MIGGTDPSDGTALSTAVAAINAALTTLQRLGLADKADALLDEAENTSTYAALDADREHNQDWLRTQYAKNYISVMTSLASKLAAAANLAGAQDADDAAKVFGVRGIPGDPAALASNRRDAGDRIAAIDLVARPDQLGDLLASAVRQDDIVLTRAIAETAVKNGDSTTTTAFQEAFPNLSAAVERLWTAEHRKMTTTDVKVAWRIAALKPSAIGSLQNHEIQAAAAGQTSAGSWNVG